MTPRLTHFPLLVHILWLTAWAAIPRSIGWISLSPLRWLCYDALSHVLIAFLALCILYRPKTLTRFETWSLQGSVILAGVNFTRELFGVSNGAWEIVLAIPAGLTLGLIIVDAWIRKPKEDVYDSDFMQ